MNRTAQSRLLMQVLLVHVLVGNAVAWAKEADLCTYDTWVWDTKQKKSVLRTRISKSRNDLTTDEKDTQTGCTVCEQDQLEIAIPGIPPFQVCKRFHSQLREGLAAVVASGWQIKTVSAYRVGRTRGPVNEQGHRTQFSNHSYGTAIDINAEQNGLYSDCVVFGPTCTLSRGGKWNPQHSHAITPNTPIYEMFRAMGWKWGGEIAGKQKDFMHFSVTGY